MLLNLPTSLAKFTIPNLHDSAKQSGFIVRGSLKMDASNFVQTMVSAAITGKGSYDQLAHSLGQKTGHPMSRQGMEERFEKNACVEFLTSVHDSLIEGQILSVEPALKQSKIKRR